MSALKCRSCGAPAPAGVGAQGWVCEFCNATNAGQPGAHAAAPVAPAPVQQSAPAAHSQMVNCHGCGARIHVSAPSCPKCGAPQPNAAGAALAAGVAPKSRVTAAVLALLLGGLGVHKFYIGKIGMGILYLVFCWTYIPGIIGFIEGILYLTQTKTDAEFTQKYVQSS